MSSVVVALVLFAGIAATGASPAPWRPDSGYWLLKGQGQGRRWVVIRDLPEGHATGLYHVEVLERQSNQKPWQIKRLAAHIAVTASALNRSVGRPVRRDEPYPEHFQQALRAWRKLDEQGHAPICTTSIQECLR